MEIAGTTVAWSTLAAVAIVFLFAGFVKGIVAIGLPAISISLLSHIIGVREAVFITLAPAFLTSVAQAGRRTSAGSPPSSGYGHCCWWARSAFLLPHALRCMAILASWPELLAC